MAAAQRAPREAPPPGKFVRSVHGTVAEITNVAHRDARGRKLYRLFYLATNVRGSQEWTLQQLIDSGVQFLRRRPRRLS